MPTATLNWRFGSDAPCRVHIASRASCSDTRAVAVAAPAASVHSARNFRAVRRESSWSGTNTAVAHSATEAPAVAAADGQRIECGPRSGCCRGAGLRRRTATIAAEHGRAPVRSFVRKPTRKSDNARIHGGKRTKKIQASVQIRVSPTALSAGGCDPPGFHASWKCCETPVGRVLGRVMGLNLDGSVINRAVSRTPPALR